MSRVDENGTVHPTDEDPVSLQATTHMAYCRECNVFALPAQHNITSPCHGTPVWVVVNAYGDVTIWCEYEGCTNTWDKDGKPE